MLRTIGFVLIFARDFATMLAFYRETLGLPLREEKPDSAAFSTEGATVELLDAGVYGPRYGLGAAWASGDAAGAAIVPGFKVADIEADVRELRRRGVRFLTDVLAHDWGKNAFFVDAEGNRLELAELS